MMNPCMHACICFKKSSYFFDPGECYCSNINDCLAKYLILLLLLLKAFLHLPFVVSYIVDLLVHLMTIYAWIMFSFSLCASYYFCSYYYKVHTHDVVDASSLVRLYFTRNTNIWIPRKVTHPARLSMRSNFLYTFQLWFDFCICAQMSEF